MLCKGFNVRRTFVHESDQRVRLTFVRTTAPPQYRHTHPLAVHGYGASDSDRRPIAGPRAEPPIGTVNGNVVVELLTAALQESR
jgi:hypothetical protein